jgi:hypothetical protein
MREPLGVVDIFIACDAAVDSLAEQIGERKLVFFPRRESLRCWVISSPSPAAHPIHAPE